MIPSHYYFQQAQAIAVCQQLISNTSGTTSLIFFVHIHDCMQQDLCDSQFLKNLKKHFYASKVGDNMARGLISAGHPILVGTISQ